MVNRNEIFTYNIYTSKPVKLDFSWEKFKGFGYCKNRKASLFPNYNR